jgi:hypothetical protein
MKYIRGFFLGGYDEVVRKLKPRVSRVLVDGLGRELEVRLYNTSENNYIITVASRFPKQDAEVEMQYQTGKADPPVDAFHSAVRYIQEHKEEADYLFRLAKHYADTGGRIEHAK